MVLPICHKPLPVQTVISNMQNRRMHHLVAVLVGVWVCLSVMPMALVAADTRGMLKMQSLFSWYENQGATTLPFSHDLQLHSSSSEWHSDLNFDLRFNQDLNQENPRFDLYHGSIVSHFFAARVQLEVGRIFLAAARELYLLDGVQLSTLAWRTMPLLIYAGFTHASELGSLENQGKIAGIAWQPELPVGLVGELGGIIEDHDGLDMDPRLHVSLRHKLHWPVRLDNEASLQYSGGASAISDALLSTLYYFTPDMGLSLTYQYRDPLFQVDLGRDPILALFASSGVHSQRLGWQIWLLPGLQLNPAMELAQYEARDRQLHLSQRGDMSVDWHPGIAGISSNVRYSYWNSYGGEAHLLLAALQIPINPRWQLRGGGEWIDYTKITQENAQAHRLFVEGRWQLADAVQIISNLEVNANETVERELRLFLMLEVGKGWVL